jgi:glycosyltransferase involved in cell wall biosynthesis
VLRELTTLGRRSRGLRAPSEEVRDAPTPLSPPGVLRVLHLATRYRRGGSERRIRDLVWSLPEARHEVLLGRDSDPELARRHLAPTEVEVLPSLVRDPHPAKDLRALRAITARLRGGGYDLVVTHQSKAGVLGRVAARRLGGPPVIHSLSMASFGPGYPRWQDLLFRRIEAGLVDATAAYAVCGEDLAARYAAIGVPEEKLHVIRSGIRLPSPGGREGRARRATLDRFGVPADRAVVLFLGALEARKRALDLVPFLGRLLALEPASRPFLVVAGEGPLRVELARRMTRAGLAGDAALVGFVPEPGPLLAAADVVVLLSRAEGLPQVLVQAAAVGTPFVAYEVDGVGELLRMGAHGVAIPQRRLDEAVEATARILRLRGSFGPATIDLRSWSTEVIREAYRELVGSVVGRAALARGGAASALA